MPPHTDRDQQAEMRPGRQQPFRQLGTIQPSGQVAARPMAQNSEKKNTIDEVVSVSVSRRVWITAPALETAPAIANTRRAWRGAGGGVARRVEMRPQHHHHADEADDDRDPAIERARAP